MIFFLNNKLKLFFDGRRQRRIEQAHCVKQIHEERSTSLCNKGGIGVTDDVEYLRIDEESNWKVGEKERRRRKKCAQRSAMVKKREFRKIKMRN